MITFGKFLLVKKTKTENKKGTEYKLFFEDEYGNKITAAQVETSDYIDYGVGDEFGLDNLQQQSRLG